MGMSETVWLSQLKDRKHWKGHLREEHAVSLLTSLALHQVASLYPHST